jgi:hypothetical protein
VSDEDIIIPGGGGGGHPLPDDDFETMLELLLELAQSERREFLAYLLRMALIEARNHPDRTCLPH